MVLSIVTTIYRSSPYLREFYERVKKEAEKITFDYEIIFVNDGSPDDSLAVALSIQKNDSRVCVVDLSRNFGHHKAIMTGLSYASGEKVFLIDCDLEEEPEFLGDFHRKFCQTGCDVVYGVQAQRKGKFFERLSGDLFYSFFNFISDSSLPSNVVTARLMSRRYVESLLLHREREVFLAGVWHITGFEQVPFEIKKHSKGTTTYSLRKKVSILVNAVTSFSDKPLIYIFYTGAMISLLAACYMAYILARKLLLDIAVGGWTSLIVSVWFLGGLTIFFIGVIGIYLSKIFVETKARPYTIVRAVHRSDKADGKQV